jgi:hypothetical protein
MYDNITAKQFMSTVLADCNQYVAQALFTDSYLYNKLNNAIFYILNYKKRYWNVQVDILGDGVTESNTYSLSIRPKLIEFVKDALDTDYKKLKMTVAGSNTKKWFTINNTTLTL